MSRFFLGLTGASGHAYAQALARALLELGHEVDLSITEAGCKVLRHELGIDAGARGERLGDSLEAWLGSAARGRAHAWPSDAIEAPPSSGTALSGGAAICPCSVGTLARVAWGFSSNLVERAADVALKERRTLVLVVREAPLSSIHLENMLRLARAGAVILPASPGFYHRPRTIDDLVLHVAGKALDALRVPHALTRRWQGLEPPEEHPPAPAPPRGDASGEA